ncbi:phosphotransferase [Arthrobacter sp. Soc17.1.1.1]|uniref:phosphotransferase n=1 Tax=Arthrobacter sp. Soc17.1.1.1 TaxID=3121277 RepID=UPI002FE43951
MDGEPAHAPAFDRAILGPADVTDEALAAMVAEHLGVGAVELTGCRAEVAEYDLDALTTAGRFWVHGTARHAGEVSPYSFFVKVVQSWTRSPQFANVPEPLREIAAASLPWRNEPAVYRSDLGARLPDGLSMPRAYAVIDIDDLSAGLWLQSIEHDASPWRAGTFARAAYLLGRLAASPTIRPLRALGSTQVVRSYAAARLEHQVLPVLHSEELWAHPLIAPAFGGLRKRLHRAVEALPGYVRELEGAPLGTAHGDACPRNLLAVGTDQEGFALIDFGLWCEAPLGFDLTQLLIGEVQLGERSAAELTQLEALCLPAYHQGLSDEGCDVPIDALRRTHALLMLMFFGLTAVPLEVLFGAPAPGSASALGERARAASFVLDLVESTTGT